MKREELYPIKYLSFNEWDKLKSHKKLSRDDLILHILYYTGCTVNELVNIKIKDIDFRNQFLHIRKSSSRNNYHRRVFLSQKVLDKINTYLKENPSSEYLFSTRQSRKMTTKRVRQIVQSLCLQINIKDATPQILRYTHIAHAYQKNIPVDAIQKQVGIRRSRAIEIFNQLKMTKLKDAYREFEV
ncbi:MAG: tyrosine-type recombinase/integrase [Candidatus Nanoarchaeia archaeon]